MDDGQQQPEILCPEWPTHIYGACSPPDGRYLLFTRTKGDSPPSPSTLMALIRWADAPIAGDDAALKRYPDAKRGPRLDRPNGLE